MIDTIHIEQFALLFAGLTRAKGRYVLTSDPSQVVVGDKAKGKATTISEEVTLEDYRRHLLGEVSLGIVPVRDDGTCVFGAIDIDQYTDIDHAGLAKKLEELKIPGMVCRSKSGGAHVYVFAQEPGIKAPAMIDYLKKTRTKLGIDYRKAREIFPKQKAQSGGIGNWINLPYFGETPRRAVKTDGTDYSFEEFITSVKRVEAAVISAPQKEDGINFTELPPCLERLVTEGIPSGMRNEAVFNFAVFAAKKHQLDRKKTLETIELLNQRACQPPLQQREIMTILDSVLGHDYNYRCDQPPIVDVCNKVLCQMRPYGPQATTRPTNIPEIERIDARGEDTDETLYYIKLAISPKAVIVNSKALMDYDTFRRATMDQVHMMLPAVKKKDWDTYITARFASLTHSAHAAPERTKRGMLLTVIEDWVRVKSSAKQGSFSVGQPFLDGGHVFIGYGDLCALIKNMRGSFDITQVARVLEDSGWEKTSKVIDGYMRENLWSRPVTPGTDIAVEEVVHKTEAVEGHIVLDAPADLPVTMLQDLSWETYSDEEWKPEP